MRLDSDRGFLEAARDGGEAEGLQQLVGIRMVFLDLAVEASYFQVDLVQCHRNSTGGQITLWRVDGWDSLHIAPAELALDLAA